MGITPCSDRRRAAATACQISATGIGDPGKLVEAKQLDCIYGNVFAWSEQDLAHRSRWIESPRIEIAGPVGSSVLSVMVPQRRANRRDGCPRHGH